MEGLQVVALSTDVVRSVRDTRQAPTYGHPAHTEVAKGYGPCRHCLANFAIGSERRILFTYDAFHGVEQLPLPGPVFIHEQECARFPLDGSFPDALLHIPMTLNAYAAGRKLLQQVHAHGESVKAELQRLLADRAIAYVHVRNREAGCYMFRVKRRADDSA